MMPVSTMTTPVPMPSTDRGRPCSLLARRCRARARPSGAPPRRPSAAVDGSWRGLERVQDRGVDVLLRERARRGREARVHEHQREGERARRRRAAAAARGAARKPRQRCGARAGRRAGPDRGCGPAPGVASEVSGVAARAGTRAPAGGSERLYSATFFMEASAVHARIAARRVNGTRILRVSSPDFRGGRCKRRYGGLNVCAGRSLVARAAVRQSPSRAMVPPAGS